MMEFILTKVWMVLGGLALAAVVLASFSSLNHGMKVEAEVEAAKALSELIESMASTPHGEMYIDGWDLISGDACLVIRRGSIWLEDGDIRRAVPSSSNVKLLDKAGEVDELRFQRTDVLVLRSVGSEAGPIVQLEKVEATALTASTNFLHSSSLL